MAQSQMMVWEHLTVMVWFGLDAGRLKHHTLFSGTQEDREELSSASYDERLSHDAEVEQLELHGTRLHYRKVKGTGPPEGWVSLSAQLHSEPEPARTERKTRTRTRGRSIRLELAS